MRARLRRWYAIGRAVVSLAGRLAYRIFTMKRRVLPTFFVLGPPRSGTTSLDSYLRQHPSYRTPLMKELGYNHGERRRPHGELLGGLYGVLPRPLLVPVGAVLQSMFYFGGAAGYRKLFPLERDMDLARESTGCAATADSTVHGLYVNDTVDAFPYSLAGDQAKYITVLRSPAEFLYSFYSKEIGRLNYPVNRDVTFETFVRSPEQLYTDVRAVGATQARLEGWRPVFEERDYFDEASFNFATALVCYVVFVKRWASRVPSDRFLVLSFSDLRDRTQETLDTTFEFLGMPPCQVTDTRPKNVGKYGGKTVPAEGVEYLESVCRPYNEELYDFLGRDLGW